MEDVELRDFATHPSGAEAEARPGGEWSDCRGRRGRRRPSTDGDLSSLAVSSLWSKYIALEVDHAACRDHFALERTFLAYIRTAAAVAQFGVAVAQLFRLSSTATTRLPLPAVELRAGKAVGATAEAVAVVVAVVGAGYFARQQANLVKGVIVARGYEVWVLLLLTFSVSPEDGT